jgi:iron complex outermembrane recepter protein
MNHYGIALRTNLLGCAAVVALAWAGPAFAQESSGDVATETPAPADAQSADPASGDAGDIVVTGSRLRGVAPVGSTITALSRQDIIDSGAVSIDRMLRDIPQVFDLGVSENSRGQSGGNGNVAFGNSVNLRGIGPYATLVLVDGHRVISNSRNVDPSVLPTLGVERVEVIADGASAIYGSDAIAGVVNIIPRRSLNGAEFVAHAGIAGEGDFNEWVLGAAFGHVWDRGQVMVAYEHVFRSSLNGTDRDFFTNDQVRFGGRDYRAVTCNPGNIRIGATNYAIPPGGVTQGTAGALIPGTINRCDTLTGQDLFPEQRYDTVNATATFEITDWLSVFADGFYSRRTFTKQLGTLTASLTVPQTNAFFVRPAGFAGTSYIVDRAFTEVSGNDFGGHAENWQVTPGIRAQLPGDWVAEAIFGYGENDDLSQQLGGVNNAALTTALASSDPNTAFDPYGLNRTSPAVLAALFNQIDLRPVRARFTGYEARLNGSLVHLPGGNVKLAVGYEGQENEVGIGSARGNPGTPVVFRNFSRRVDSAYAELLVPLFGPDNARPGFERLEIDAAVRYDDYSDVGSTTNPKFGISYSPVRGLTFRGSYGTSFRAPLISQIYGNSDALFGQSYQNPAGGPALLGFAYSGANLDLKPEEATTWSVGADVTHGRFRAGITYFDVEYRNQVETYLADLNLLSREAEFAGTGVILRGPEAAARVIELLAQGVPLARGSFPGGNPANVTLFVDGRNRNLGTSITRGIDVTASYIQPTDHAGTFGINLSGTYLTSYRVSITPNGTLIDRRNTIFQPLKFRARATLSWEMDPVSIQLRATHVGGYTNNAVTPVERVSSYTPIDLSVTWTLDDGSHSFFGSGFSFGLEVRNMFDVSPPYVNIAISENGGGGYDPTSSNPVGRFFGFTVRKSWH